MSMKDAIRGASTVLWEATRLMRVATSLTRLVLRILAQGVVYLAVKAAILLGSLCESGIARVGVDMM